MAPLIPALFRQQFASLRQSRSLRFQPEMGSLIVEHPGGSEDGELSSAVLGPPSTSRRGGRWIRGPIALRGGTSVPLVFALGTISNSELRGHIARSLGAHVWI